MPDKILYKTAATASGDGRNGTVALDDSSFTADLATPKELGGAGGDQLNPEKMFAMGYAACFLSALRHVASAKKVKVPDEATVNTEVGIGPNGSGGFGLDVSIRVSLPGLEADVAQDLVDTAHAVCPYSNATRNNLDIRPVLA